MQIAQMIADQIASAENSPKQGQNIAVSSPDGTWLSLELRILSCSGNEEPASTSISVLIIPICVQVSLAEFLCASLRFFPSNIQLAYI
jgi:hypothetical protein